jgi:ubiquinone/menaquinone biosynthesis C-methylase UbiE
MNADSLARWYRWIEHAVYGRSLERCRFAFLERLSHANRVLMLGEGDGRALERLLKLAPQVRVDVVESSAEMIALARARCSEQLSRVTFAQQDALTVVWPRNRYDAVTVLFFLDCFTPPEVRVLIRRAVDATVPGGFWLVGDFAVPDRGWRRWHAKILIAIMYRFFGVTTGLRVRALPPIEHLLLEAGLRKLDGKALRGGMIRSEIWQKPESL